MVLRDQIAKTTRETAVGGVKRKENLTWQRGTHLMKGKGPERDMTSLLDRQGSKKSEEGGAGDRVNLLVDRPLLGGTGIKKV